MKMSRATPRAPDHLDCLLQTLAHALECFRQGSDLIPPPARERDPGGLPETHLICVPCHPPQRMYYCPIYRGIDDGQQGDQHHRDERRHAREKTMRVRRGVREGHGDDLSADDFARLPAKTIIFAVARDQRRRCSRCESMTGETFRLRTDGPRQIE